MCGGRPVWLSGECERLSQVGDEDDFKHKVLLIPSHFHDLNPDIEQLHKSLSYLAVDDQDRSTMAFNPFSDLGN
jgi:hypothetical protein